MSIVQAVTRQCKQKAVYWGNPVKNGYGGYTYDDPVEIDCRWEEKSQFLKMWDAKGDMFECIGVVWVLQDVDKDGVLCLGTLASLGLGSGLTADDTTTTADDTTITADTAVVLAPVDVSSARLIRQFEKLPKLGSSTRFVRRAFLSQFQYR